MLRTSRLKTWRPWDETISLTHGYTREADSHLYGRDDGDGCPDAHAPGDPVKRVKREDETEEVLEDDHHREALNCEIPYPHVRRRNTGKGKHRRR